ncbi:SDR family oxidoreductase [bacterium]|nr:SDR family oxidoreductase [bacterium]
MILLTGASGFLGQHIYKTFLPVYPILGLGHSGSNCDRKIDLTDLKALEALLDEIRPDTVIHSAAIRDPDECVRKPEIAKALHIDATKVMAEWCRKFGKRLVYISTDYVFNGKNPPYNEQSEPDPVNLYGETKLAGEKAAAICPDLLIIRIALQYGTTDRPELSFIHKAIKTLSKGEKLPLDNVQKRFPSLSADVAKALLELEKRHYKGLVHMSNPVGITRYQMFRAIAAAFGFDPNLVVDTGKPPQLSANRPADCAFDLTLYKSLGLPPFHSFEEGLEIVKDKVKASL